MSVYTPDRWKVIHITNNGESYFKVFATWGGGYTYGSSWKLSSGGNEFTKKGDMFEAPQISGSLYELHKDAEGICGMWNGLHEDFVNQMREAGAHVEELNADKLLSIAK